MSEALSQAFEAMSGRYKTGVVAEPTTFYFSLGPDEGQKWVVQLRADGCDAAPGKTDQADVVLKTSEELFLKLIRGEWVPGVMDFMSGKIKSNDPTKLMLLKECFA